MAIRDTITFGTGLTPPKLVVTYDDATESEYLEADAADYLVDWPDRQDDILAMGWPLPGS